MDAKVLKKELIHPDSPKNFCNYLIFSNRYLMAQKVMKSGELANWRESRVTHRRSQETHEVKKSDAGREIKASSNSMPSIWYT